MELSLALRIGYFAALTGNIIGVPIFDSMAPEEAEPPYIILSTQTNTQRLTKSCKLYDASLLVDIVTRNITPGGRKESEEIGAVVEELINPDSRTDINIQDYQIVDTWRGEDTDLVSKSGQFYVYRKLMRYNHSINKL
jgi:hypothetical protein